MESMDRQEHVADDEDPLVALVRRRADRAVRPGTPAWAEAEGWVRTGTPGEAAIGRAELFDGLLPLLLRVAERYGRHAATGRLVRAGLGGLRQAVDHWEPERGFRLDTYATWSIRQAITRDLAAG